MERIDANCEAATSDYGYVTWSVPFGYPSNAKCEYNITINPNTEFYIISNIYLEDNADIITFYEWDGFRNVSNALTRNDTGFRLFPGEDGSQKQITFEFISDANIERGQFELNFYEIGWFFKREVFRGSDRDFEVVN